MRKSCDVAVHTHSYNVGPSLGGEVQTGPQLLLDMLSDVDEELEMLADHPGRQRNWKLPN